MTLIEHGADVTNWNAGWVRPLHLAAEHGHTECVTALLRHGADINVRELTGLTPLHGAAAGGHVDCFEKLVQSGADTTLINYRNETALDVADESTKQQMCLIVQNAASQKLSSRDTDTKTKQHPDAIGRQYYA